VKPAALFARSGNTSRSADQNPNAPSPIYGPLVLGHFGVSRLCQPALLGIIDAWVWGGVWAWISLLEMG
jgi:hypothetical protein